jgi:hypothetical protein
MKKKLVRVIGLAVLAALMIGILIPGAVAAISNDLQFYGEVTHNGANVPTGTTVTASIDGNSPWTRTVFVNLGGKTWYSIPVPATGRSIGDVVHFTVNIEGVIYEGPDALWQTPQDDEETVVRHPINVSEPQQQFGITTTSLADGQVGVSYSATLEATGGPTPYSWSATGLPAGLNLSPEGNLTGIPQPDAGDYDKFIFPQNIGEFEVTFIASDSLGNSDSKTLILALSWLKGDANGDGEVNIADVTKVELIILRLTPETPGADANQDGEVNIADVTMIELMILKLV